MIVGVIKSKIKIGTIRDYTEHGLVLGLSMRLKMGKEYISHSWTGLKDTEFTPVLARKLCMGLTLNTYQSPLEEGRLRSKGQQSLDNSSRSMVGWSSTADTSL